MENKETLEKAKKGDINAFHQLFSAFKSPLKSFLYRLLSDRDLVDDFYHDTFIKAFDKISLFEEKSSLKTWCFSIASNMCIDYLRKTKRWPQTIKEDTKAIADQTSMINRAFTSYRNTTVDGEFDLKEHIDFCFTCLAKTIEIDRQVAIILKDVCGFSIKEVAPILGYSYANTKKTLHRGRKSMNDIFNQKCALINKKGVCHQCSELNGAFNPKQNQKEALLKVNMIKANKSERNESLYKIRTELIKSIDPYNSKGVRLHDFFMDAARFTAGEIAKSPYFEIDQ